MNTNWTELYRHAAAHGGVATSAMAVAAGVPRSTFHRRVRRERWLEIFPGAWLVPGATCSLEARHWAALLSSGPDSALSHSTALRLLDLDQGRRPRAIHVVRPYGRGAERLPGLVRHRSRTLDQRDLTNLHGLTATNAARSLRDVANDHLLWQLEGLMLAARQRGLVDEPALLEQHERRPGLAGAGKFLAAASLLESDGADSILERRARRHLQDAGLHPSSAPHPVVCGDRTLYVDLAFPEHRFGIECDGFAYHGPDDRDVFERDRDRWRLLQDAGWRFTWLTWRRLHEHPNAFVAEVRRKLAA